MKGFAIVGAVMVAVLALLPMGVLRAQQDDALTSTTWQLVAYGPIGAETPANANSTVTLVFGEDNRISGSGGCNSYGGSYSVNEGSISFDEVISTLMACFDEAVMAQEAAYFQALAQATTYSISDGQLIIQYGDGQQMIFVPALRLENTQWQLSAFGSGDAETPVLADSAITLTFESDNRAVGSGGCNTYGTTYNAADGSIQFEAVVSTRVACADETLMTQEQSYFDALQTAIAYTLTPDQLTIQYGNGGRLVFVPLQTVTLENTQWELVSFGTADTQSSVLAGSLLTLQLNEDGTALGSGGCNSFRTTYTVDGSAISFDEVLSTRRACADAAANEQEMAYFAALQQATGYMLEDNQLIITYGDGMQLIFQQSTSLANTAWQLEAFGVGEQTTPVIAGSPVTLIFGEDGQVSGSGGCNSFSGSYSTTDGSIQFGEIVRTERACLEEGVMTQEDAFLTALGTATGYTLAGDQLTIFYGENNRLVFGRTLAGATDSQ